MAEMFDPKKVAESLLTPDEWLKKENEQYLEYEKEFKTDYSSSRAFDKVKMDRVLEAQKQLNAIGSQNIVLALRMDSIGRAILCIKTDKGMAIIDHGDGDDMISGELIVNGIELNYYTDD